MLQLRTAVSFFFFRRYGRLRFAGSNLQVGGVIQEPAVPEEGVDTAWTAEWRSYMLSRDHIPTDKTEAHRVQGAGGKLLNGRVMGSVNITR